MADDPDSPPHRDSGIFVRVNRELREKSMQEARPYGGLSAVIRAFLRAFTSGERNFDINDLKQENTPAPKRPRKPKPTRKKKKK